MTTVLAFFIGLLCGGVIVFIAIISGYGTDADDYYGGHDEENSDF